MLRAGLQATSVYATDELHMAALQTYEHAGCQTSALHDKSWQAKPAWACSCTLASSGVAISCEYMPCIMKTDVQFHLMVCSQCVLASPQLHVQSSMQPTSTCMLQESSTGNDRHQQCRQINADTTYACVHHDQCRLQLRNLQHIHGLCYKPNLRRGVVNGVRMPGVAMEQRCLSLASCSVCTCSAAVAAFRSATACICLFMTALCSFSLCHCSMREV